MPVAKQRVDPVEHQLDPPSYLAGLDEVVSLVRKIERRFQPGDQIEQRRKRGAEVDAPAAAMADAEDALEFLDEFGLIIEIRGLPVERMAGRSLETPFAYGHSESAGSEKSRRGTVDAPAGARIFLHAPDAFLLSALVR